MSYKHGDWYCKPASKAEAKEIIDRAVASGAENMTNWCLDASNYCVYMGRITAYPKGKEYTIDELRHKFPLPGELEGRNNQPDEWDGEGFPPVGTECELWWGGAYDDDVEIIQYRRNGNHAVFWRIAKDCVDGAEIPTAQFRPLRTEREKWIEAANIGLSGDVQALKHAESILKQIYDLLKSGQLKVPGDGESRT